MSTVRTIVDIVDSFESREKEALAYKNGYRTFRYSYKQLSKRVKQAATWFRLQGLKEGDRVMIWGPNLPEWGIAYLGAIYADLVVVPADLLSTHDAVERIAKRADVSLVLQTLYKRDLNLPCPIVHLEEFEYDIEEQEEYTRSKPADENASIEIVFTSGTTGDPKGVVLTHKNILTNVEGILDRFSADEDDVALSLLPLSHMLEQTVNFITPLMIGMKVVYVPAVTSTHIFKALEEEEVSIMVVVPRILQSIRRGILAKAKEAGKEETFNKLLNKADTMPHWVKMLVFKKVYKRLGKSFRTFVTGGAPLDFDTAQFWKRIGVPVIQGYGLSECSPVLTVSYAHSPTGSVGPALCNVDVRLGSDGEVQARGENIFSGYYQDKEKTAEVFNGEWFLTGDIGEFDEQGELFIRGRKKDVIVSPAGKNIYPDDIEDILNEIPGVAESCVVGIPVDGGEEVHAELILKDDAEFGIDAIIERANKSLDSSQKIIHYGVWSEPEFPKTATMKIKRNVIRNSVDEKTPSNTGSTESHTKLHMLIAQVTGKSLSEISETKKLVPDLGLDSVGRVELAALIAREYNFELEEELITEQTTVKEVEQYIAEKKVPAMQQIIYPKWPHKRWLWPVRLIGMQAVFLTINRIFVRLKVSGQENLEGLEGPVIFVANHVGFGDHSTIMRSLPPRFRYFTSSPAKAEFFDDPTGKPRWWRLYAVPAYYFGAAVMSVYKMPLYYGFKKSLQQTGVVLDQGMNIILFPEGRHTLSGKMEAFRGGIGVLTKNVKVTIVPIGHRGLEIVFPDHEPIPKRGDVHVTIGKPIRFTKESAEEIRARLEYEVRKLAGQ